MNFKTFIVYGSILLIVLWGAVIWSLWGGDDNSGQDVPTLFPDSQVYIPPNRLPDTIGNRDGITISDQAFLTHQDTVPFQPTYVDGLYRNTSSPNDYAIDYFKPNGKITIQLYREPLTTYRLLAEQQLQDVFQLPLEDYCDMDIQIYTHEAVNPVYSKGNLGLSFCPGSVELK